MVLGSYLLGNKMLIECLLVYKIKCKEHFGSRKILLLVFLYVSSIQAFSQAKFTIRGDYPEFFSGLKCITFQATFSWV